MAIGSMIQGVGQTYVGYKGLKALEESGGLPEYGAAEQFTVSPELQTSYQRAQRMADQGYAPEEKAQFEQGLARQGTLAYRRGTDIAGGSLAGALQSGINASNLGALNQFAAADASLRRRNVQYADSLSRALQSQYNLATQARQQQMRERRQRYTDLERAYGAAMQSGMNNVTSGVNAYEAENKQAAMSFLGGGMGSMGGGGNNSTPPYM